jgi:cysteine-rich repeat protein
MNNETTQAPKARILTVGLLGLVAAAGCSLETEAIFGTASATGAGDATSTSTGQGGSGGAGSSAASTSTSGSMGGSFPGCGNSKKDGAEECDDADLGGKTCVDLGYVSPGGLSCFNCHLDPSGCTAACNNGVIEPGEACDGDKLGGKTCVDYQFSNPAGFACLAGCAAFDTTGCKSTCNGTLEPGETCDGNNLNGHTCQELGYTNPAGVQCSSCALDGAGCKGTCDGTLEPDEPCDGNNLNGHTCKDFGYAAPAGLQCSSCALNTAGCKAVCGNGTIEPGESCDDGNQTSGDGCSALCQFEGLAGATCASAIPVSLGLGTVTKTGTTVGGGQHASQGCTSQGPDRIYAVTPIVNGFLTASLTRTQTAFNSVLYASNSCLSATESSFLCADSHDPQNLQVLNGGEVVSFPAQAGTTYYLFVDGPTNADAGAFQIVIDLSGGDLCSDPIPIPLEPGTPMRLLGSTVGMGDETGGLCAGAGSPEVVYEITRSNTAPVSAYLDPAFTDYNSVLYARKTCLGDLTQFSCSYTFGNGGEMVSVASAQGGVPFYLYVDGSTANGGISYGNYGLLLTP